MCYIDLEPCTIWNETHHKARKEHTCSCCGRTIRVGECYMTHFSIFEGETTSEKCCNDCEEDRQVFADAHEGTLCSPGWLENLLRDCISDGDDDTDPWKLMLGRIKSRTKPDPQTREVGVQ
jgi:hypothetical protein